MAVIKPAQHSPIWFSQVDGAVLVLHRDSAVYQSFYVDRGRLPDRGIVTDTVQMDVLVIPKEGTLFNALELNNTINTCSPRLGSREMSKL
jgi:hypothetical protein